MYFLSKCIMMVAQHVLVVGGTPPATGKFWEAHFFSSFIAWCTLAGSEEFKSFEVANVHDLFHYYLLPFSFKS